MSLLPAIELTQDEISKQQAIQINRVVDATLAQAKMATKNMFDLFWNNKKATPQEIAAVYGTGAITLFTKLATWQGAIQTIDPDYVPLVVPSKYSWVANGDGSVTITG